MNNLAYPQTQMSSLDREAIRLLCEASGSKSIVEIGCWTGETTAILASYAKKNGGSVTVIDTFKGSPQTDLVTYAGMKDVHEIFVGNMESLGLSEWINVLHMSSDEAHKLIKDKSVDLLFIDGDHLYEQVRKDLDNYIPKVKPRGIISGHDLNTQLHDLGSFNQEFLTKNCVDNNHYGVIQAVGERLGLVNKFVGDSTCTVWWIENIKRDIQTISV